MLSFYFFFIKIAKMKKNKKFSKNTLQSKNKVILYITCDAERSVAKCIFEK